MSSFYDDATRKISQAIEEGDKEKAVELARQTYQWEKEYLFWIAAHALKAESFKVENLVKRFNQLNKEKVEAMPLEFVAWELHEEGHDIGRARIRIRGGGYAGDNPYFPGHYGLLGEERRR